MALPTKWKDYKASLFLRLGRLPRTSFAAVASRTTFALFVIAKRPANTCTLLAESVRWSGGGGGAARDAGRVGMSACWRWRGWWCALALLAAAAADCPPLCECKWRSGKESALCARAGLDDVPPRLAPTTQLLDLKGNHFATLKDDAFASAGLLDLQRLYLSSCGLHALSAHAFRALVNLVELDLSDNRLTSVPSHAFAEARELRELRLDANRISRLKDEAFIALPNLVRVDLSECRIVDVESRAFAGVEGSLQFLELDGNRLQTLHAAALAPLRALKGLELAANPWDCSCALRPLRDWMLRRNVPATVVPECKLPPRLAGQPWDRLDLDDFACPPEVSAAHRHANGLEGGDVTLTCRVSGVPAPRVRWLRAGRPLANTTGTGVGTTVGSRGGRALLLRGEGQLSNLTIRSADVQDAGAYTCTAENRAGRAEASLTLVVERRPPDRGFGGRAVMAGVAVSAVIVLGSCLVALCAYETRKKRQAERWNEQIVTQNRVDDNYEKIEANFKESVAEVSRGMGVGGDTSESGRKRGDYRNVPSHDSEEDTDLAIRAHHSPPVIRRPPAWPASTCAPTPVIAPVSAPAPLWRRSPERDLHIPRLNEYSIRSDSTSESGPSSASTGLGGVGVGGFGDDNRLNNNPRRPRPRPRPARARERLDNDLSGSDSDKNYPDLIEMSALGPPAGAYYREEARRDPPTRYFCTLPRRRDDSRSPLLGSRRNSSGGDSAASASSGVAIGDWRTRPRAPAPAPAPGRRSTSFLDLSASGGRATRNPSLPASPSHERPIVPSATPLLDLSGLRDYSRYDRPAPLDDYDFRASQLERFLEEYCKLRDQLSKMKETRETLMRSQAADYEEGAGGARAELSVAVTRASVGLPDAASPLALSADYRPRLPSLLYRN
ncbi:Leucine-rich repeat-containing protein 24 [Eumeta japonica]|uniref:Leucine-rich repeat-containing protein 24 n=1 Tax=Eumeta variegata TaxID=151549 RepID=A0A4C1X7U5_EUMVA|nr:Leucine-rich repeat-containing protein 24 [Eumeta japonica]